MEAFRLNGEGKLEKIEPVKELPIGTKIYAFGAGMSDQYFCITGPMTNRGQEMCLVSNWYPDSYFSTPRQYFDKHSRPLSKKFGIGFYWDDIENIIYPLSKVEAARRRADIIERKIAEMKEAERLANKKEIEELPSRFPHLKVLADRYDYMALRSNIVAHLKHCFPEIKFSIKKSSYQTIYVHWTDGVAVDRVSLELSLFEDHKTDYTGDYRDYDPSNFNTLFGGINYIFEERQMSDEIQALSVEVEELFGVQKYEAQKYLRNNWYDIDIPTSASNFRIEKVGSGYISEKLFKIVFDINESEKKVSKPKNSSIELIEYSPKSFAVIGETKPLKDTLKELGGSFNFRLSCGAGWIFPNTKKEAVVSALSL